jgi:rhizosphere induced protein
MAAHFQVNITNNSSQNITFILFQKDPNSNPYETMSTVWFSKRLYPSSRGTFDWSQNYNFVAGQTGQLMPGVQFNASEMRDTDPNSNNSIVFGNTGRGYGFTTMQSQPGGRFTISTDPTIPQGQYSVGMGMSGFATFVSQARPNMNYMFSPNTEHWVAFGNYVTGQVLDSNLQNAVRIVFPSGVTVMNVVLNPNNQFTITNG